MKWLGGSLHFTYNKSQLSSEVNMVLSKERTGHQKEPLCLRSVMLLLVPVMCVILVRAFREIKGAPWNESRLPHCHLFFC